MKARIQLGFDIVEEKPLNLKPIIANLRVQVEKHQGPIISGKPAGMRASKPPLATGPSFMPGSKSALITAEAQMISQETRSHSIGPSQDGKRRLQPLPQVRTGGSQSHSSKNAAEFVKRLQKEKEDRVKATKEHIQMKDQKFLSKLRETIDNRTKVEKMKEKEKKIQHDHMLKKLEA